MNKDSVLRSVLANHTNKDSVLRSVLANHTNKDSVLRSVLANHTHICCYVLYCMFQGISRGRTHGYVVHVSDAACRVE